MLWRKTSKADDISNFIKRHVKAWTMTAAMDGLLGGHSPDEGPTSIGDKEFDQLILNASIYGAADSYGQSIGASPAETAEGIKKHLRPYSDGQEVYEQIIVLGTMPEFADVVSWTGQCVYEIRAKGSDAAKEYLQLFDKIKERYGSA
jgi:hypothetical protein